MTRHRQLYTGEKRRERRGAAGAVKIWRIWTLARRIFMEKSSVSTSQASSPALRGALRRVLSVKC